jgi:DNA-binding MarR family transcriptional regulator
MTAHSKGLNSERLLQLSSEVGRIANTLAMLSTESAGLDEPPHLVTDNSEPAPEISPKFVAATLRARRLRSHFFGDDIFADPAWDMMLHLFYSELRQQRVQISNLCAAANVPATTALRWLKSMNDKGLFVREDDPLDRRRSYVKLAPQTSRALRFYFAELAKSTAS